MLRFTRFFVCLVLSLGAVDGPSLTAQSDSNQVDPLFRVVAPILEANCLQCHNDDERQGDLSLVSRESFLAGGESGPVFLPKHPERSPMLLVVSGEEPEMPQDGDPLSKEQVRAVRQWLSAGAPWPQTARLSNLSLADRDWWSLKPLRSNPPLPATRRWKNPVDHFVAQKHAQQEMSFSPEADRPTLIRRLYYDLTGLPPTPDEVRAFVEDQNPQAYEKLVERLLDSKHYGERWARHWLDVVQFGETHGYDKDKPRPNAWPYRDYVIRSFNEDKSYSRFVQEQLAGDLLWPDTTDGIVATGFIAAGPWDFIGHAEVPETKTDGQVARNLDRDNMVTSTMNTFCSLTVQCARCHNHKLDPVTMKDYYRLQAVFASLDRADRQFDRDPKIARRRANLLATSDKLKAELKQLEKRLEESKTDKIRGLEKSVRELNRKISAGRFPQPKLERSDRYGYHSQVAGDPNTTKWVQVDLGQSIPLDTVVLTAANEYGWSDFGFPHRLLIEASETAAMENPIILLDHRKADFPRPGAKPVVVSTNGNRGRFIRVTATRLWNRRKKDQPKTDDWIFALGELSVVSKGRLAKVEDVSALDSIEAMPRWGKADLIDGIFADYDLETKLGKSASPTNGFHSQFATGPDQTKWVQLELERPMQLDSIELLPAYPTDYRPVPGFGFPVRFKVEVSNDPSFADAFLVEDQTKSDVPNPLTRPWIVNVPLKKPFQFVRLTATRLWDRGDAGGKHHALALSEINLYSGRQLVSAKAVVTASDSIDSGRWKVDYLVDGFTSRMPVGQAVEELVSVRQSDTRVEELRRLKRQLSIESEKALDTKLVRILDSKRGEFAELESKLQRLPSRQKVYAGTVHQGSGAFRGRAGLGPRAIRILHRGDVTRPGPLVRPGTVPFVDGLPAVFPNTTEDSEGIRRVQLAKWIVHRDNPLTWRSIVNRIWHYHFGKGLVDTPNDFGRGGSQPTHPELLAWLAVEFRDGGKFLRPQSIKSLHRLICNSRTYRQTSTSTQFTEADRDNRFLWRMNRRPLSAEEIHDSALAVSDHLDRSMYGPSYRDFVVKRPEHSPHYEYQLHDPYDPKSHRRAIYRFIVRSQPQPFMDTLNCADPSMSVPRRSETLTALQALGMLNNQFMVAMSDLFAQELASKSDDLPRQVQLGFERVCGRPADEAELKLLVDYAHKHGLKNTCRVLLNLNEFVFVD